MFKDIVKKVKSNDHFSILWPKIEKIIIEKALPQIVDKLRDDNELELLFRKSFELLPTTIRLLTTRDKFISFCMKKKESIIHLIVEYKKDLRMIENKQQLNAIVDNKEATNKSTHNKQVD